MWPLKYYFSLVSTWVYPNFSMLIVILKITSNRNFNGNSYRIYYHVSIFAVTDNDFCERLYIYIYISSVESYRSLRQTSISWNLEGHVFKKRKSSNSRAHEEILIARKRAARIVLNHTALSVRSKSRRSSSRQRLENTNSHILSHIRIYFHLQFERYSNFKDQRYLQRAFVPEILFPAIIRR